MPRAIRSFKSRGLNGPARRTMVMLGVLMSLLVTLAPSPASAADPGEAMVLPSVDNLPPVQPAVPMDPATTPDLGPPTPAQKWEQGKEILARRTANTKTFAADLPGSYETKFFAEPVHFDDDGKWVNIEAGLRAGNGATVENRANEFGLNLAEQADSSSLAKVEMDPDHSISMRLQGADDVEGDVRKNSVTYQDARTDTDVRLTSMRNGFKEELILSSADAPDRFVYPLALEGLTAAVEGAGDVVYRDQDGLERARTPHGFMYDSNVDPNSGEPAISNGVTFAIIPHGAGQALEIKLDRQWLDSPDREWPVTVDPDTYVYTKGDDTFVMSPFNQNYSSHSELKVGKPDSSSSVARAFMHFDTTQLKGVNVTNSALYVKEAHSWSCTQNPGPVYRVLDSSWTGASMTQFPGNATADASPAGGGWADASPCHSRWASWNILDIARVWAATHDVNGSVSLRASNEGSNLTWKKYHSANTTLANTPFITVSYTSGDPFGSTDDASPVPSYGSSAAHVRVRGWAIDPDTTGSIQAHAYAFNPDGSVAGGVPLNANQLRTDVGNAYPGYGNYHGYDGYIPVPGPGVYNVCVAAINVGQGNTTWLPCRSVTVMNYPGTPQSAQATANPDGTVKVTWVGPASNGGSAITGFNIQAINTNGSLAAYRVCSWGCRTATFNELTLGTSYTIKVYAQNAVGYSLESTPVNVVPAKAPEAPGAPTAALDGNNVDVTWTAPAANGATIIRYDVRAHLATNDAAVGPVPLTCDPTCRAVEFTGLTAGTAYKFKIYAVNSVQPSVAAVTNTVTIPSPTVPDVPGNPEATLDGDNVDVTWTPPAAGPALDSYRVQAYVASNDTGGPEERCDSPCTSVEFTGLAVGTTYKFKIYAVNSTGESDPAETGTVTIPEQDPDPEPTVPYAPVDLHAVGSSNQVVLTWQPAPDQSGAPGDGGSPVTGHTITLDPPCGGCTGKQVSGETYSTNLVGLEPGTTYVITVIATNSVGDSSPSVPIQFTADSETPGAPTITEITGGDGIATVRWDPPSDLNGSTITGYQLSLSPSCPACAGLTVGSSSIYAEITGLSNDVEYSVRVAATTDDGPGAESAPMNVTPHRPTYAALGDSFSAGQGAPPYDLDEPCKRSTLAYGPQFVGPYSGFDNVQFLACAGDVIEQVSAQVDQIEGHPDLITLSAGGNDARFSDVLTSCGNPFGLCEDGFFGLEELIDDLYQPLVDLYSKAKDRADAADADVVVFGYPQLFGNDVYNGCTDDLGYTHEERVWIRSLVSRMNDVIQRAGSDSGITVIQLSGRAPDGEDPMDARSFDGNEICSSEPFINGLVFEESKFFHPNSIGYAEMTSLLEDAWEELRG